MPMYLEAYAPTSGGGATSVTLGVVGFLAVILAVILYLLPFVIAKRRGHTQATAILLLNLFLGWSFIGWVIALVWAVTKEKPQNTDKTE